MHRVAATRRHHIRATKFTVWRRAAANLFVAARDRTSHQPMFCSWPPESNTVSKTSRMTLQSGFSFTGLRAARRIVPDSAIPELRHRVNPENTKESRRCHWAKTEFAIAYHDREWGVPLHDD